MGVYDVLESLGGPLGVMVNSELGRQRSTHSSDKWANPWMQVVRNCACGKEEAHKKRTSSQPEMCNPQARGRATHDE